MPPIIDTHSHLYSTKFTNDLDDVILRAKSVLSAVFLPNIDLASIEPMHQLVAKDPQFFFPLMGLHPTSVQASFENTLQQMEALLNDPGHTYYGIGETGLDLYWDKSTLDIQQASLRIQIEWAKQRQLPIILHARNAIDETFDIIAEHHDERLTGIFHCFDGDFTQFEKIKALSTFKVGIGGIVTYRKDVQAMVKEADLDYIVLETDSPYLPPAPHRKDKPRRNESSYTRYVAEQVAELHGSTYEEIAAITNRNALEVFPLAQTLLTAES